MNSSFLNLLKTTSSVTVHCLIGCSIGEILGLVIGVIFLLGIWPTMILATILAFISGMILAIYAIRKKHPLSISQAFKAIFLGELLSISAMELAMNGVDYYIGGVAATSLTQPIFWIGLAFALPAGYIAAFPVNYWLIKKSLKKCH